MRLECRAQGPSLLLGTGRGVSGLRALLSKRIPRTFSPRYNGIQWVLCSACGDVARRPSGQKALPVF